MSQHNEDAAEWFRDKDFDADWTSHNLANWQTVLAPRRDETLDILEIGSWEGRSAVFFLRFLRNGRITCIDHFGSEAAGLVQSCAMSLVERRFDSNLAEFHPRVNKIRERSRQALARLLLSGRQYDLVYIDGDHGSMDVISDAVLCWPMIRHRGILIFDDYLWTSAPCAVDCPKLAIDSFLAIHAGQFRELSRGYQVIVEKTVS